MTEPGAIGRVTHRGMASAIRAPAMDAVEAAQSGHPGMPMGMADAATVLWTRFLRFDPAAPGWPDRDRFVLSAGQGSKLLYAMLHLTGFPGMDAAQLRRFRQPGSMRGYGASAPAKDLYAQFGITPDALVEMARARLAARVAA